MDIGNLDHAKLKALKQRLQESAQEKYLEESRKRLDKIISQKIRTTFIGALDVFEQCFGFLWGHGKAKDDLTDQEEMMRVLWEDARSKILNKSNNQLRAVRSELNNNMIHWNRYRMDFAVKPLPEENTDEKDV